VYCSVSCGVAASKNYIIGLLVSLNILWLENDVMLRVFVLSVNWERSAGNLVRFQEMVSVILN